MTREVHGSRRSSGVMASEGCVPYHDWFNITLTYGLCVGLIISYLPQHLRIIQARSSEGISPWFLLLGTTSVAAGFLNMITMQWRLVKCCRYITFGSCAELTAGILQVGTQWILFTFTFVLYMIFFPNHLKYIALNPDLLNATAEPKILIQTSHWRLSNRLARATAFHFVFCTLTTIYLLSIYPSSSPNDELHPTVAFWTTILGVTSAIAAAVQYAPQLDYTYRHKLVGALSIPMMCIQTPGAIFMVTSIALRPGTNWTTWLPYAVAGLSQGGLLVMCICWKLRQQRLGIDDFGRPLDASAATTVLIAENSEQVERTLIVRRSEDQALIEEAVLDAQEHTPLLGGNVGLPKTEGGGVNWFGRVFLRRR